MSGPEPAREGGLCISRRGLQSHVYQSHIYQSHIYQSHIYIESSSDVMSVRQEKVQEQLVQEISEMIQRDLGDPRLGFVTVTGSEISKDLRHAKVFVSIMGDAETQKQSLKALNGASGLLRGEFARRAHMRVAPELVFQFDESIARGARIFELLYSVEGDLKPRPDETSVTELKTGTDTKLQTVDVHEASSKQ